MIVEHPATIDDVSRVLRAADSNGERVRVVGGGTHAECVRPRGPVDVELRTGRLDSIAKYAPEDMTISVQAGMTAARLSALLAQRGSRLPLDVEEPERATIGGIAAAGWSGPRRLGMGSLRELLIGARAVLANGTVVKTGGMVVKNVSGYDLTKLLHGSFGSLAAIVELNLKLLPMPARQIAIAFSLPDGPAAVAAATDLFASRLPYSAIEAASDGTMIAGCEGHAADVERLLKASGGVAARFGGRETSRTEGDAETARTWSRWVKAPFGAATATFRIASLPDRGAQTAAAAARVADEFGYGSAWRAGIGRGAIDVSVDTAHGAAEPLAAFERELIERFGSVRVTRCPDALRSTLAIFGRPVQGLALMRALKAQFDPNGVLNAGTNIGGI